MIMIVRLATSSFRRRQALVTMAVVWVFSAGFAATFRTASPALVTVTVVATGTSCATLIAMATVLWVFFSVTAGAGGANAFVFTLAGAT